LHKKRRGLNEKEKRINKFWFSGAERRFKVTAYKHPNVGHQWKCGDTLK